MLNLCSTTKNINPFQPGVAFYTETFHLICNANLFGNIANCRKETLNPVFLRVEKRFGSLGKNK